MSEATPATTHSFDPSLSGALLTARPALVVTIGVGVSLVSAALHIRCAARFRRSHVPSMPS